MRLVVVLSWNLYRGHFTLKQNSSMWKTRYYYKSNDFTSSFSRYIWGFAEDALEGVQGSYDQRDRKFDWRDAMGY